jgi:hypothetical protein
MSGGWVKNVCCIEKRTRLRLRGVFQRAQELSVHVQLHALSSALLLRPPASLLDVLVPRAPRRGVRVSLELSQPDDVVETEAIGGAGAASRLPGVGRDDHLRPRLERRRRLDDERRRR